ncbi:MAG: hypothetical protein ABUK01_08460 [Leptospirales bacterium]
MKNIMKTGKILIAVLVYSVYSVSSLMACSTCTAGYSESKMGAYGLTVLILSILPTSIGLTIYYVYRKGTKQAESDSGE